MEVRNGAEALKTFLGVSSTLATNEKSVRRPDLDRAQAAFVGDEATLSQVGTKASDASGEDGVRADKVAAAQQALEAGTYRVDSAKVAEKLIESMGAGGQ